MRKYTKHGAPRACNLAWCERDLEKRYDISPADVRSRGQNVSAAELANHDPEKEYVFTCPCCLDECQNATCEYCPAGVVFVVERTRWARLAGGTALIRWGPG